MQYIPSKKQIPSWMRMNDNSSRHWMTSYYVDMEVTSAQDIESCRRDYVQGKCNAIADANPELKLRNYLCKYLTDQGNGGRAPYCTMSGDSTSVYPEYMPCVNSDGTTDLSKPECKLACSENKNQLGCSTKFTAAQIDVAHNSPEAKAAAAAAVAKAEADAKAAIEAAAKAEEARLAAIEAEADAKAKAEAEAEADEKAEAARLAEETRQYESTKTKCVSLNFWTPEDPGCENTSRKEPGLKLRQRICQHMTDLPPTENKFQTICNTDKYGTTRCQQIQTQSAVDKPKVRNEWCGMYDKNGTVFPELSQCLTPDGQKNTECKLMCSGRPSQVGCEWYADMVKAEAEKAAADSKAVEEAKQADAARTACIGLNFWTGEDPGCEINARREPELKLRERMCQHMTNEGGANSNEWCGMYDKNEMIFPEFADCLTPEGKMNTKCKLMCNGRPSQKGCEWYADFAAKEAADKAEADAKAKKAEDIKFAKEQCGSIDKNGIISSVWNEECSAMAFTNPELKIRQRMCTNININTIPHISLK